LSELRVDGKQLPQSATTFTPAWQQYRKLGRGTTKEPSPNVSERVVPRRALPIPKQTASANLGRVTRPPSMPPSFVPARASMLPEQEYKTYVEVSNAQSVNLPRPNSTSPPPPPLPPRPHVAQQGSFPSSPAFNPSPPKEARKLPSVPQGAIVGTRTSAIESLKSIAPPLPVSSETIDGTTSKSGPTTGRIPSPAPNGREEASVTISERPRGVTGEAAPAAFDSANGGSPPGRITPSPVPGSPQRYPNAPLSSVRLEERREAPLERSGSPVIQDSVQESGAGSSVKAAEASVKTRSPPPKFSSFISRTKTTTASSSWPPQQEPQSMAMRMAALELEQEADAARQRTLATGRYDDSDDEDDESESSSEAETDRKLIKIASGPQDAAIRRSTGDYSIPDIQVNALEPMAEGSHPAEPPSIKVSQDECITIAIPVPQINLPDDDDGDDDPQPDQPHVKPPHSRRPSITISPTPSVHARVRMDRPAPEPPRFMSSAPGSAGVISGSAAAVYGVGTSLRCAGCREPIVGRIVSAMNQRWHPACFKCVLRVSRT
jgi:hypothetical protein